MRRKSPGFWDELSWGNVSNKSLQFPAASRILLFPNISTVLSLAMMLTRSLSRSLLRSGLSSTMIPAQRSTSTLVTLARRIQPMRSRKFSSVSTVNVSQSTFDLSEHEESSHPIEPGRDERPSILRPRSMRGPRLCNANDPIPHRCNPTNGSYKHLWNRFTYSQWGHPYSWTRPYTRP